MQKEKYLKISVLIKCSTLIYNYYFGVCPSYKGYENYHVSEIGPVSVFR
jgi:hypothetical protein